MRQPWPRPAPDALILGLCAGTHDSAAALLRGGVLIGFCEEERLSGVKHTSAYPQQAVGWLLAQANATPADIGVVAYNFDASLFDTAVTGSLGLLASRTTAGRAIPRARSFAAAAHNTRRRLRSFRRRFPNAQVVGVRHHRAHGEAALAAAQVDSAAVLVVDSLGETETTTIARATTPGAFEPMLAVHDPHSLGYVYGAVTQHLGWPRGDGEGTVMALAAQGDPERFAGLFADAVHPTRYGFHVNPRWFPARVLDRRYPRVSAAFTHATCPPRYPTAPVEPIHADLAATLQTHTTAVLLHLAETARWVTGERTLCAAGGVAMNCVALGRVAAARMFDQVLVPPAPGDAGTALGAAAAVWRQATGQPIRGATSASLGPAYTRQQVRQALQTRGMHASQPADPASLVAEQLAAGKVVGLFQGGVEAGPRALGHRSMLASPLTPGIGDRLTQIKRREPWRPFAPVVSAEHASDWFMPPHGSPYMSLAVEATPRARAELGAVVHTNGTARVQLLTPDTNPLLAAILTAFASLTGIPVLINTSLNPKGHPIAGTPAAALDCLEACGLDGLLIEGLWVTRTRDTR